MNKKITKIILFFSLAVFFVLPWQSRAAEVGEGRSFFVDSSYDALGRAAISATLREIGEHAYFYTEDEWWDGLGSTESAKAAIAELASEFDQKIYPRLTQVFGLPWEPGIDNDPKITILIFRIQQGAGGYFNSADEYPRGQAPQSNEREMIYLNSLYYNAPRAKSFLAHEFQHLITFYQKDKLHGVSDDVWLNEARSEYAATLAGYDAAFSGSNLEKRILDFYKNPSDSLTEWGNLANDYGSVNLFMQYLVGRFGNQILTKMMQTSKIGIASINEALKNLGAGESFSDIFLNWTIANYINDCRIGGQKYCYLNAELSERIKISPTISQAFPVSGLSFSDWKDFVKDWSGHWYKFSGGNSNLKIDFKQPAGTDFSAAYIIQKADGSNEVKLINIDGAGQGSGFVPDFSSEALSVILVPVSMKKMENFGSSESFREFSYRASLTTETIALPNPSSSTPTVINPSYPDGSLIRAKGDFKVYIVSGKYKRWIQTAEIFNSYGHLKWSDIIEVMSEDRDWYKDSWLIRTDGDARVYEINGDGTKHWLNMTADEFSVSGRLWEMVYIINKAERDFYKTGAEILFQ